VTFAGDELRGYEPSGPGEHIKLFFPAPGERSVPPFTPDENGRPIFTADAARPVGRTYTPLNWDPEHLQLDVDFVTHASGAAISWLQQVEAGDEVYVVGPAGPVAVDPNADWYLIAGDESAIPAIVTMLQSLPASLPKTVLIEVGNDALADGLADDIPGAVWLSRDVRNASYGKLLMEAVRSFEAPAGRGKVFVACEASLMREIRRFFLGASGMSRETIHTHGYWKLNESNHPDHDLGEDV